MRPNKLLKHRVHNMPYASILQYIIFDTKIQAYASLAYGQGTKIVFTYKFFRIYLYFKIKNTHVTQKLKFLLMYQLLMYVLFQSYEYGTYMYLPICIYVRIGLGIGEGKRMYLNNKSTFKNQITFYLRPLVF